VPEKGGGGCFKAFLIMAGIFAGVGVLGVGACLLLVSSAKEAAKNAPPSTLSADEQRLGKLGYCPGSGLKGLGFSRIREAPPCPVELHLGRTLKDPSSYQGVPYAGTRACSVSPGKDAWLVDCSFRAKNSFGALVVHTQRFHVLHGVVTKVEDAR
jgi:hypothetical protein